MSEQKEYAPGSFCRADLVARDAGVAKDFYTSLFGWTTSIVPNAVGGDYTVFMSGEEPRAGMLEIRPDRGEMPSHRGVYFQVENLGAALEKARGLGPQSTFDTLEIEDKMRIGGLMDPQGACFTVVEHLAPPV